LPIIPDKDSFISLINSQNVVERMVYYMVKSPQYLVSQISNLVSLPEIYLRVNKVIEDPQSTADSVAKVICFDPALTAKILQIANSPIYSFSSEISTVSKAVSILGTKQIRDLVLASSVSKVFDKLSNDIISMYDFWKHSVFCGLVARTIAYESRKAQGEFVFIAGLLHDIGKLVIYSELPDLAKEAFLIASQSAGEVTLSEAEQQVLGFDHSQVGGELIQLWKLPLSLQECVEYHHIPGKEKNFHVEVAIIHLANAVSNLEEQDENGDYDLRKIDPLVWQVTGLDKKIIEPLIAGVQAQVSEVQSLLSMT